MLMVVNVSNKEMFIFVCIKYQHASPFRAMYEIEHESLFGFLKRNIPFKYKANVILISLKVVYWSKLLTVGLGNR